MAAHHYLITSTSQIKPSVLTKLKGNAGRNGAAGAAGTPGAQGPQGPAGPTTLSALTVVNGPTISVPTGEVKGASAICPAGTRAVSGGGNSSISGIDDDQTATERGGWFIIIDNETGISLNINAQVLCAGAGQAVAASAQGARRASVEKQVELRVAALKAEKATGSKG